jgi:hypothetical protein
MGDGMGGADNGEGPDPVACDEATPCGEGQVCAPNGVCRPDCRIEGAQCPEGRMCNAETGLCNRQMPANP